MTGTVRVVRSDDDFMEIQGGDVLVCPIATTSWGVLLSVAAAIVCDGGGAFSCTAITARELGIPAVPGTGHATRSLETGMQVTATATPAS